jgi:hypothetical protein
MCSTFIGKQKIIGYIVATASLARWGSRKWGSIVIATGFINDEQNGIWPVTSLT